MAGERVTLEVKAREDRGSRPARRLRRQGFVLGVLYGSGDPTAFYVEERRLRRAIHDGGGMNAILDVVVEGASKPHHAVIKDYQLDARRSALLHVDFHEVRLDRPIQATVPVELTGTPEGLSFGGLLNQVLREVTVEALPMALPERIELDVTALNIGDNVKVSDMDVPDGVTIVDDPESVVATVSQTRRSLGLDEEEEAEAEGEEGAAEEESEAAAETAADES